MEKAIRDRVEDGVGNLYVLVNYTALVQYQEYSEEAGG